MNIIQINHAFVCNTKYLSFVIFLLFIFGLVQLLLLKLKSMQHIHWQRFSQTKQNIGENESSLLWHSCYYRRWCSPIAPLWNHQNCSVCDIRRTLEFCIWFDNTDIDCCCVPFDNKHKHHSTSWWAQFHFGLQQW